MATIRCLKESELEKWLEFVPMTFSNGNPAPEFRQYFRNHYYNDPLSGLDSIFVALEEGEIASTLRVFNRKTHLNGTTIATGGIGEVCTDPKYRAQGLSTKLLEKAIEYMNEKGLLISTLRTGLFEFYRRRGWAESNSLLSVRQLSEATFDASNFTDFRVREIDWEHDLSALQALHEASAIRANGVFVRDNQDYWTKWVACEAGVAPTIVTTNDGTAVAYLFAEWDQKVDVKVKEFCALPGYERLFDFVVCSMRDIAKNTAQTITCSANYPSELLLIEKKTDRCNMLRLNRPFDINDKKIETTEQLLEELESVNGYNFHLTDGY